MDTECQSITGYPSYFVRFLKLTGIPGETCRSKEESASNLGLGPRPHRCAAIALTTMQPLLVLLPLTFPWNFFTRKTRRILPESIYRSQTLKEARLIRFYAINGVPGYFIKKKRRPSVSLGIILRSWYMQLFVEQRAMISKLPRGFGQRW